ncbi:MAG: amino acid adenylation domain-containing protein, partial [Eubacterium sp.]|nr:amino acid adenylation domain-containing protein [Eubacterium sp.]
GQKQALFCTVENGRHVPELKNTYGMLVHTLPLHIPVDEKESVTDYLQVVQDLLFESLSHDLVSIVQLANEYEVDSDILFAYQGEMLNGVDFNGAFIPFNIHKTGDVMSKLSLDVFKQSDDYILSFEYRKDLYLPETVEHFPQLYLRILEGMLSDTSLGEISFIGEQEKDFYRRVNDNRVDFDRGLTVVEMFRRQAAKTPENTAVVFEEKKLTYSELDRLSENLAKLLACHGVTREVPVGIMVNRTERYPICTLGVLKAGGACQPLDSNYPQDRLLYMLSDSKAPVVIADDDLAPIIEGYPGIILSTNELYDLQESDTELTPPSADSLFALIYTSGSTGKPKGCMLEHRNLVNYCISFCDAYHVTAEDHFSAYNAFGFDASMHDFYVPFSVGAPVYIVPEETRLDLPGLHDFVLENQIAFMDITMQLGRQYVTTYPEGPYPHYVTVGGEKLVPCETPEYQLVNTYGPTECTIGVTLFDIDRLYESVPIGKSFGNCDIYIVDGQGRLLPPGAVGELAISGYPVARGYLNRPDLTEEKFIRNPFSDRKGYEKMYLTGDVCRYLSDGNIQYVGRRDEQVKIRGFRIELTEIERRIREYDGITDATVIARDLPSGGKAVIAYVVSGSEVDVSGLNHFIGETLPEYMIPSVTMQVESIPLNPNGKVDKRKLPDPVLQSHEESVRELNTLEQQLCDMVTEITGFENHSVTDSLISMGLTSLTTIMFSAKLYDRYGVRIGVSQLMEDGCTLLSVENLILEQLLSKKDNTEESKAEVDTENVPLCAEQLGVYFDSIKRPDEVVYNIPMKYTFSGSVDVYRLKEALEKLIAGSPVLTSRVVARGKDIVQQQIEDFVCEIPVLSLEASQIEEEGADFVKPFNLARGPLFRAEIIRTEQDVVLFFDVHHIIMDGLSLSVFIRKLTEIYDGTLEPACDTSYYAYIAEEIEIENSKE